MRSLLFLLPPVGLLLPMAWAGQARYARLGDFEGPVEVQLRPADAWIPAERNLPLPEGAWFRTGGAARLEVELDDGAVWRLGSDSAGALADYAQLSTGQRVTLLTLDRGLAYFSARPGIHDSVVLAVPGAQIAFTQPARVRVETGDGFSRIAVLEGSVRFSSPAAEIGLVQGQTTRVDPADPVHFSLDRVVTEVSLDAWSAERDHALESSVSSQHTVAHYGLADLDGAGAWVETDQWGTVWKPKAPAGWTPFRNGRWRWYDTLGYTFVGGDAWGWLPYHYGRWAHSAELGWIWAPSVSQMFKPGDVFWLIGEELAGWGPLAPGERWPNPDAVQPSQFVPAYLTFAAYAVDARVVDPAGFTVRHDDPLKVAAFAAVLPSPPLEAARLEALRPLSAVGAVRVAPVIAGVTYEGTPANTDSAAAPAPADDWQRPADLPPPVVIFTAPPDQPAPDPQLVPYPVAVYATRGAGAPRRDDSAGPAAKATGAAPSKSSNNGKSAATAPAPTAPPVTKTPLSSRERRLYADALENNQGPSQQIGALDKWSLEYPQSTLGIDRMFLYMQAYSRLNPPRYDRIVEYGERLLRGGLPFPNSPTCDAEKLSVLYQVTANVPKLAQPSARQINLAKDAARALQDYLPVFFSAANRPSGVDEALWAKARDEMEGAAKHTLAFAAQKR
jgi:hypothetical protein